MPTPTLNANQMQLLRYWQGRGIDPVKMKAGGSDNSRHSVDRADRASSNSSSGDRSGSSGRPGGAGNQGQTNRGPISGSTRNPFGAGQGNSQLADKYVMDKYIADPSEHIPDARSYWDAVGNLGKRHRDYMNTYNTPLDSLGNAILGLGSIGEVDPTQQALGASIGNVDASWGIDPLGAALSLAGMATGLPVGSLYSLGKKATGYDGPMLAFDGYHDQTPFSGSVSSPMVSDGSAYSGPGAPGTPHSKENQTGTSGLGLSSASVVPMLAGMAQQNPNAVPPPVVPPVTNPATGTPAAGSDGYSQVIPYPFDPLRYGEVGGEWKFFNPAPRMQPLPPIKLADGGDVRGPGDGQDDKIPALLSEGEHIVDSMTISALGRGSNEAGHKKMEEIKQQIRRRAGIKNAKKAPLMSASLSSLKVA